VERSHIEALKAAADPAAVAAALGLRSRGKRFFCPACQSDGGKTPDLVILDKGFFCHKCGLKGDLLKLVEVAGHMDFKDAVAFLERHTGLYSRPGRNGSKGGYQNMARPVFSRPGASSRPWKAVSDAVSEKRAEAGPDPAVLGAFLDACRPVEGSALAWLKAKVPDLPDALVEGLRLRFCGREYLDIIGKLTADCGEGPLLTAGLLKRSKTGRAVPSFWHYYAKQAGFLVIPYLSAGRPVYLKARPPMSKADAERKGLCRFLNTAAAVPCLYNVDALAAQPGRVWVCEGETDTWTALSRGEAAVGSPGARQFKAAWVEGFRGFEERAIDEERAAIAEYDGGLSRTEAERLAATGTPRSTVFLVMDADAAGIAGAAQVADLFLKAGLPVPRRVMLPPGMDLTDYLADAGSLDTPGDGTIY
jgi:hypothetical protein